MANVDIETERPIVSQNQEGSRTNRQRDRQTDIQTDKQRDIQTETGKVADVP